MNDGLQSDQAPDVSGGGSGVRPGAARPVKDADALLIPRLGRNLIAGLRLAFFRRVAIEDFSVDFAQIVALFVVNALATCLVGFLSTEPPRAFFVYGLTSYATHAMTFMAAVLLAAAWLGRAERRSALFVTLLSGLLIVDSVFAPLAPGKLTHSAALPAWILGMTRLAVAAWWLTIAARAMKLTSGLPGSKVVLPAAGYALIVYGMTVLVPPGPMWYSSAWSEGASSAAMPEPVDAESTYYEQGRLMRETLDQLAAERPGISDVYFVGFANYGHQDVFRKEIELVRGLMEERYDARGRSISLINNAATVDRVPLANRPNLAHALEAIGESMDPDEDVLFLFMTSHGSEDGVLAARFWPLRPNDVSSSDLKQALDASAIRWRILVISACYSGSFIDPLKDDYTLILTASRKDRNSFGCSDDRELTYFGEHLFDQELRSGKPLLEAFEAAKASLAERELKEGFTPSEPQMHLGPKMRTKLAEIEAALDGR